jgi:hypothetical protein
MHTGRIERRPHPARYLDLADTRIGGTDAGRAGSACRRRGTAQRCTALLVACNDHHIVGPPVNGPTLAKTAAAVALCLA